MKSRILIVDDQINAIKVLSSILTQEGYEVFETRDVDSAINILQQNDIDAVITDLKMPGRDGMDFLHHLLKHYPDIPVIFLTAYGTVENAVEAMKMGAYYYFIKPPDFNQLKGILARAVEQRRLKREIELLKRQISRDGYCRIVGNTPQMLRIYETIDAVKDSLSSVMIVGETGTGKELIARSLHYNSKRRHRPFVAVNCAAIPKELLEAELFGYERGAFTGAISKRIGKMEEASDGTLFFDEIGEMELSLQAKILRVLQEREIERLGGNKKIRAGFRLICSTNRNLKEEVRQGRFREDLFYRINVVEIHVPPLRERREDIPLLAVEFLKEFCVREGKEISFTEEAMRALQEYDWPGNVRQLKNAVERAVVLSRSGLITLNDLPEEVQFFKKKRAGRISSSCKTLKELEIQAIRDALRECEGNKSKVARMLGISRKALYKRLKELNISTQGWT